MKINNKININEIKTDVGYEGYLWLSNASEPIVLNSTKNLCEILKEIMQDDINPFVIEGYLYDNANNSYSIKYVDGKCQVYQFTIDDNDRAKNKEKVYYANRMEGKQLRFLDVWEAEKDPQCLGMEVLQPKAQVFIGFATPKTSQP